MKNTINTNKAIEIIRSKKIFSAWFVKKDGTIRYAHGRTGVRKHLKPNAQKRTYKPNERGYVTYYDFNTKEYRLINLQTLFKINHFIVSTNNK